MRRRGNSNAQEQAKQFIANAGSMFSKWGVNIKNGASKLGGKTVRATTHAFKSTQKLGYLTHQNSPPKEKNWN